MDEQGRQQLSQRRRVLRRMIRALQRVFSRSEITGLEYVPSSGPLLIVFNHLSILDGPLVAANMPGEIELVGPGDFPMTPLEDLVVRAYGITRINRGRPDRDSLKALLAHLRAGRMLAMAPDGGTWEKPITAVKDGAAYLSQVTETPILPVGLGGLYDVPVVDLARMVRRPPISIRFGEVMPPVPVSADRRQREVDLEAASQDIMRRIYALLPPADQARYDFWARAVYDLVIDFEDLHSGAPRAYSGPELPSLAALGEFVGKPNLFRPMWVNAGLGVEPFREVRFFAPIEVQLAARSLYRTLTRGDYDVYLHYRLGNEKAQQALAALQAIADDVCEWAMAHDARIRLRPVAGES